MTGPFVPFKEEAMDSETALTIAAYDNYTRTLDEALRHHRQCQNRNVRPSHSIVTMYRRLIFDAAQRTERYDLLEVINYSTVEEKKHLLDMNVRAGETIEELPVYYFERYELRVRIVLAQIPGVLRNLVKKRFK